MDPNGTIKLVGAILRGTPSLPGAACIGRHELYDEIPGQSREARAQRCELAADLCSRCPGSGAVPGSLG